MVLMDTTIGLVLWHCIAICLLSSQSHAQYRPKWPSPYVQREIFLLNLEDGYFGCQVNESTDFLQLFELSKLCDGIPQCFQGSDEVSLELKCTDRNHCHPKMPKCSNGVCLDNLCYCNDGFGGKGCDLPDENECKYRPCDVFARCTNTMGSYYCSCFPGYDGDGFSCHDINECEIPSLAALCADNAECCNLPGHFVCKCKPGYTGNATVSCTDIDECLNPSCCGRGAICENYPGSYSCNCPLGFEGDPQLECWDIDECKTNPCGSGAFCTNIPGGYECSCPAGYKGNPKPEDGCIDIDECASNGTFICGNKANCLNTPGGYFCQCPSGYTGNPKVSCVDVDECPHSCGANTVCQNTIGSYVCQCKQGFVGDAYLSAGCIDDDECVRPNTCGLNAECYNSLGSYQCVCSVGFSGNPAIKCSDVDECIQNPCGAGADCVNLAGSYRCECPDKYLPRGTPDLGCERAAVDVSCKFDYDCTDNAACVDGSCRCRSGYQTSGIDCIDVDECNNRNICGNNAKCVNLKGLYQCDCKPGYEKIEQSSKSRCRDTNECLFGRMPCGANARCVNTEGSYKCLCKDGFIGNASLGCKSPCDGVNCGKHATCQVNGNEAACICEQGFTFDPNNIAAGCVDINECDSSHGPSGLCGVGAVCTNVLGSHHCHCQPGFTGDPFRYCEDINECDRRFGPFGQCGKNALCTNALGSYQCSCPVGYTGNAREKCIDINECSLVFGPNGKCGFSAVCTNTLGSFSCRCPPGSNGDPFTRCVAEHLCDSKSGCVGNAICKNGKCVCPAPYFGENCKHPCDQLFCGQHAKCELDSSGNPLCACAEGYIGKSNSLPGCADIDECANNPCGQNAVCRNTPGSYECICPHNFRGDPYAECAIEGKEQITCSDTHPCPLNEECIFTGRANQCVCRRGYIRDSVGEQCRDVNECTELSKSPCGLNAFCTNLDGGYVCHCPSGYTGNSYSVCYPDIMKCVKDKECPGNTICIDDVYHEKHCGCQTPFVREGDYCILMSRNCSSIHSCPQNQECIYSGSGYGYCICPKGFTLEANGFCRDINECKEMNDFELCGPSAECINLPGNYECLCASGYTGDGKQGCTRIHQSCETDKQCDSNYRCMQKSCECLPPFIQDGQTCKHPCDWQQCGQNAECELGPRGPKCKCKAGCTGNANTGCHDINECTSLLPIDPNGPCAVSAICVNVLGSYKCECAHGDGADGDPYTSGCFGPSKCEMNEHCPEDTMCDRQAGVCTDSCISAICGPNTDCISTKHVPKCQCKPGFTGNPNDLIEGCISPCNNIWCSINAQCIVNNENIGVCQCMTGFNGNPWSGGGCYPDTGCSLTKPCQSSQECVNGVCVEKCNDNQCGVGAQCDPNTHKCKCNEFFVGNPDNLCAPPLPTPPTCSPSCGLNAHCTYSTPNKCVCNSGYSGNPYKSCTSVPRCDSITCGSGATCIEAATTVECVCPAGLHGNPFLSCEDVNECLQGNPCGTGANCINVIGSFHCVCPSRFIGNPLYACQPPQKVDIEHPITGIGTSCSTTFNCPNGAVCFRGLCAQPNACRHDSHCETNNACSYVNKEIGYQCVDPCDTTQCGPNAYCVCADHKPNCHCKESHSGDPFDLEKGCKPRSITDSDIICNSDSECVDGNVCRQSESGAKHCVDVCANIQCGPNAFCQSFGRRPGCVCEANFDGNAYDLQKGCNPPVCREDSDCRQDETCTIFQYGYKDCQSVCKDFQCGINAVCRGTGHTPYCECRPNFIGDAYDNKYGCQPLQVTCTDDSNCSDNEVCKRMQTGLKNCTDVCSSIRCGLNAHCVGKAHQSVCECLPGFIGDAARNCQKPPQHLCNTDDQCSIDKKCILTNENIKDCVDACFGHSCGKGSNCIGRNHRAQCECLQGYTRINSDLSGACVPNLCQTDRECRDDQVCAISRKGILDCADVCLSVKCGANAQCVASEHRARCQCKKGFSGNSDDLIRGCSPKDKCSSDNQCKTTEVCQLNQNGVKDCVDGCTSILCGANAVCITNNHFVSCTCQEGYTGRPFDATVGCSKIPHECHSDDKCPSNAVCIRGPEGIYVCRDPCEHFLCGESAVCVSSNHRAQCSCRQGFIGDPYHKCVDPDECKNDSECPSDNVCRPDTTNTMKCAPACLYLKCGKNAECRASNHQTQCICPSDAFGDPYDLVTGCQALLKNVCERDSECTSQQACRQIPTGILDCVDACESITCGPNSQCRAVNHIGQCQCLAGYIGDATNVLNGCRKKETNECEFDLDCQRSSDVCKPMNDGVKKCFNACQFTICGAGAQCIATNHSAFCECIDGFVRDGNAACKPRSNECNEDTHCPSFESCKSNTIGIYKCAEACIDFTCTPNSRCVSLQHKGQCKCEPGYTGDPQSRAGCVPIPLHECDNDDDCGNLNDICLSDHNGIRKCKDGCLHTDCGKSAVCVVVNRQPECRCPQSGLFVGNPYDHSKGCRRVECLSDKDCADNKACANQNFCFDPCVNGCGSNAVCVAQNHIANCRCLSSYTGDAFGSGCVAIRPCESNPCHQTAKCVESHGTYSCQCPPDYIEDNDKGLRVCIHPNSCPRGNSDCPPYAACLPDPTGNFLCKNACERLQCGPNAQCVTQNHEAKCVCPDNFRGEPNPIGGCTRISRLCSSNPDCGDSQACVDGQCRFVCTLDNECALGEKCVDNFCVKACVVHDSCPPKEACVSKGYCNIGCRSNSECASNQACIQNRCQNPCEIKSICGPNAICLVDNHNLTCSCGPGFEGNPTPILGCKRKITDCNDKLLCSSGQICASGRCRAQCNQCVEGEKCIDNTCLLSCSNDNNCPTGEVCSNQICVIGCRTDVDCSINQICSNTQCICVPGYEHKSGVGCVDLNECLQKPCHHTAICENIPGSYRCTCPEGEIGDGFTGCQNPGECPRGDFDCPKNSACRSDQNGVSKCVNLCDINPCGPHALCNIADHQVLCKCPEIGFYTGDPYNRQNGCQKVDCLHDADCPYDRQCVNFICENACDHVDCGPHGTCVIRDRQAACRCEQGFENNGRLICVDVDECRLHPCHTTALCNNVPGSFSCKCPDSLVGNAYSHPGCHESDVCYNGDQDCPDSSSCILVGGIPKCRDRCNDPTVCGMNASCVTVHHRSRCTCPANYLGDPYVRCEKVECSTSLDCVKESDVCYENKCIHVCKTSTACGDNAICVPQIHSYTCKCREGYFGDPIAGCRKRLPCDTDDNCPNSEFCYIDHYCKSSCSSHRDCNQNEKCENSKCIQVCTTNTDCPDDYRCLNWKCVSKLESKCQSDTECDDHLGCRSDERGFNDCKDLCENILCGRNAVCKVRNHVPVCECHPGFAGNPTDDKYGCKPIECIDSLDCKANQVCNKYNCIDPCKAQKICGDNAVCNVEDHAAICRCQEGFEGDPVAGCIATNYCAKQVCHRTAICRNKIGGYECICPTDRNIGTPYSDPGCRGPNECPNGNSDCSPTAICKPDFRGNLMCINPCEKLDSCGANALCKVENRNIVCSCPDGFAGDPHDLRRGCVRIPTYCSIEQECIFGMICDNGRCRPPCHSEKDCAVKEICVDKRCVLGCSTDQECLTGEICTNKRCVTGCRVDNDCSFKEACILNSCKNLCDTPTSCGTNAMCNMVTHQPVCSCPIEFTGNAKLSCTRIARICHSSSDCPPNNFCLEGRCKAECQGDKDCAIGERCFSNYCTLLCRNDNECQANEICNLNRCQIGCRSNVQCSDNLACTKNQCIDPCEGSAACGPNALCHVVNHRISCSCPQNFVGRPTANVGCMRESISCLSNNDCAFSGHFCTSSRCRATCSANKDCAVDEKCTNGRCHVHCTKDRDCPSSEICLQNTCQVGCRSDTDCASSEACINNFCIDPCDSRTACGTNAVCSVNNHEKVCSCKEGSLGNAYVECVRITQSCGVSDMCGIGKRCESSVCRAECRSDNECFDNEKCIERLCSIICTVDSVCPNGFVCDGGKCIPGCRSDTECPQSDSCINRKCMSVCESPTACGTDAICQGINHQPRCSCPVKFTGNPKVGCRRIDCVVDVDCDTGKICQNYKCNIGCRSDTGCADDQSCISLQCTNPCMFSGVCGENALCKPKAHQPVCSCSPPFQGNPTIRCTLPPQEAISCKEDSDCSLDKFCIHRQCITRYECNSDKDCSVGNICVKGKCFTGCRRDEDCALDMYCHSQQCQNPCNFRRSCGTNALCTPSNHRPKCSCPPNYTGNPLAECIELPTCRRNDECPIGYVCQSGQCTVISGCVSDNECTQEEICDNGKCLAGCRSNSDCDFTKACIEKQCQSPCLIKTCGTNSRCHSINHEGICRCPESYTGDPNYSCQVEQEECYTDRDCGSSKICVSNRCIIGCRSDLNCPFDKACTNRRCSDPCSQPTACGFNALCKPLNNKADCSCPPFFQGDPKVHCLEKKPTLEYECQEDSHCGPGKVCEHHYCISIQKQCYSDTACNPGEICDDGNCFIGCRRDSDCTFDKACYNSKCVNPCTVQTPCGQNANCQPVLHRPQCRCSSTFEGNPYDYCKPIPRLPSLECIKDNDCQLGYICEQSRCNVGCRFDENCQQDKACIHRQCSNPCEYPDSCGSNALCTAVGHRPRCSCPSGFIGDANIQCTPVTVPICLHDADCGTGQICETAKCIDACRTDDTCSYTMSCINQRCQDPCSVFGACGRNAFCQQENHRAVCSCLPDYRGDANAVCEREDISQQLGCANDKECSFGFICDSGACIEGCRNDDQCTPDQACYNRVCKNPCELGNACGINADCSPNVHRPVCSCHSGFVGDPLVECRPLQVIECNKDTDCGNRLICENLRCIIGCRNSVGCSLEESCINRICQNPCSLFGVCGRNAICRPFNHTSICSCPSGLKGNPNVVCTEAPPQCLKDSECVVGQICENTQCISGCRLDNNCPEDRACIHGSCQNPCLLPNSCGVNANCQPFNHRPRCECIENFRGNPFVKCEPIPDDYCEQDSACALGNICETNKCIEGCRNDANCRFEESCINKICQNPCNLFGACGLNAVCKPLNHDRICTCIPEYTGDSKVLCERILPPPECTIDSQCPLEHICQNQRCSYGCRTSSHCPPDKACVRSKCANPCNHSGACGKEAICAPANHVAICNCPSGFRGDPDVECREIPPECRNDEDCGLERICLKQKCIVGCRMHNNCPFDKACVNGFCQSPCSIGGMCGVNTICRSEKHEAQCSCLPGYTGDPLRQCTKVAVECEVDKDCGNGYVCANQECKDINECLKERVPCGAGASCTNLPGWFKCSCPMPLVGDAYGPLGCRSPLPVCFHDADCKNNQKCNPVTQECYDICSKPGVCGKGALCKAISSKAECYCPPGYRGNPYVECSIRDSCSTYADCPGNLNCLGDYCGCSKPFQQLSSFCILTSLNCSTSNPCPQYQECVYNGGNEFTGFCICPRGFVLTADGSCRDINECDAPTFPCGPGAMCVNTAGKFKCLCPPRSYGDAYGEGCFADSPKQECLHDVDCHEDKACVEFKCINPCLHDHECGQNAMCVTTNHKKECKCRPLFFGNPYTICRKPVECVTDGNCPGNLICMPDNKCGCHSDYERRLDYCLKTSMNCTTTNPCFSNHECIFSGSTGQGFCVCPRGFKLLSNNICQDINECFEDPRAVCAKNSSCVNLLGSYECRCHHQYEGDAYREGCKPIIPPSRGCRSDSDCSLTKKCDIVSRECYDPCLMRGPLEYKCGQNAICRTENHQPDCYCPPGHEGNPYKLCFKKIVCGIDYHCPGNLICLDSNTCGCPPHFFRENDYCFIKSVNCTTSNPCPQNEECVYTGNTSGFCVCPHGYEFHPSGECIDINECLHVICGSGALCNNKAGGYECSCPVDTIGDPYVKGCKDIDGCRTIDDCANDRECDLGSKQCISPCYICGPHAECTARDHKAICSCPRLKIGDPYDKLHGCYLEPPPTTTEPPSDRTIPPPSEILVMCLADGVQVSVRLDRFDGIIYVKGHSQDPHCRSVVTSSEGDSIDFRVLFGHCGLVHVDGVAEFILIIQKHPKLVTYRARAYSIKCVYNTGEKTITLGFNVSMITTSGTIANTGPPPTCIMSICTLEGKEINSAEIGDDLLLRVDVQPDFIYGGYARSCVAKTMEDEGEFQYEVTDSNGCATDPSIFGNWEYDPHRKSLMARFNAFKFPSSNNLRFQCNIRVCFGSCPPVNCEGVDAYGRRRRRQISDEDLILTDAFKEGALREEIMVQSNAILTFEKRDPQPSQPSSGGPKIEDIEHVCLPKLGLIISMIITTLLALVAVAVAISCWLMAYRRKPKRIGPLPHPPDFPNPLYTTPEPVAEPSPDYYPSSHNM